MKHERWTKSVFENNLFENIYNELININDTTKKNLNDAEAALNTCVNKSIIFLFFYFNGFENIYSALFITQY